MSETDYQIATALIDGINADGYLEESLDDILASLPAELCGTFFGCWLASLLVDRKQKSAGKHKSFGPQGLC